MVLRIFLGRIYYKYINTSDDFHDPEFFVPCHDFVGVQVLSDSSDVSSFSGHSSFFCASSLRSGCSTSPPSLCSPSSLGSRPCLRSVAVPPPLKNKVPAIA